jgi:predicted dinucleotide-binding enzyme
MRIGVLGTGMVGRAISGKLAELGHEVKVGSRTEGDGAVVFADAAAGAEVVFNCTSGAASLDALSAAGDLAGKVLVDVSNPLDGSGGLFVDTKDSLGERIQAAFPEARVVKSLNTINCNVMVDPGSVPGDHVVFVCGNDDAAKTSVTGLLGEMGWSADRVVDLGDITAARGTEHYLMLWLRLWRAVGGPQFNIAVHRQGDG